MFLKALSSMKQPRRVLEVGMFVGYGAAAVLEGCVEDCLAPLPEFARRLDIIEGPALNTLRRLPNDEKYDLVFIDANKAEYKGYVQIMLERGLLAEGAMIVADNTLYCGIPYTPSAFDAQPSRRAFGEAIKEFNAWVRNHEELQQVVLPLRDGVSIISYHPG